MTEVVVQSPAGEGVRILARVDGKLDPETIEALRPYEGDEPYFPEYIDLSIPHNQEFTENIVEATLGHALADETGEIIVRFEGERGGKTTLERAAQAKASMRRVVTTEFDGLEEAAEAEQSNVALGPTTVGSDPGAASEIAGEENDNG